jgi:malate dehydrogenase
VSEIYIYGNHSPSMFADFTHAKIGGRAATDVISDRAWLENEFLPKIGKRGAEIINARGSSSAASAANALVDHVRALRAPGTVHSVAVPSDGFYGFADGVWAGAPVRTTEPGSYEVVLGLEMNEFAKQKLSATNEELVSERDIVKEMLAG